MELGRREIIPLLHLCTNDEVINDISIVEHRKSRHN